MLLVGLGAGEYFGEMEGLTYPEAPVVPTESGFWLFDWITDAGQKLEYAGAQVGFLIALMGYNSTNSIISLLIFAPAIAFMSYGILKLLRGTG